GLVKFFLHVVFGDSFRRREEQVAYCGLGLSEISRSAMAIGLFEVGAGAARHEQSFELAIFHDGDFLGGDTFFVNGISTDERRALIVLGARIVDEGHRRRKYTHIYFSAPVAARTKTVHQLIDHRLKCHGWTSAIQRRPEDLRD